MKSRSVVLPAGVAVPRLRHAPRVRGNAWEDMVQLAGSYGLTLLPWQENFLVAAMGERADGLWAAKHVGLSCPRQNGKGSLLEARALAGLLLFGERMIIHSAHEVRTAQIGFARLKSYFENYDDLRRKVASVGNAVAREYIRLRNGQEVRFVTRSKSAIRGFSADCLLLDEGQILGDEQWEAILYTVSARPNHQIWLVGTPPLNLDDGVVFNRFRNRGIEAKDHQLAWCEWSAAADADLDDVKSWAQANPALGHLISHETVVTERAAASDDGFARERLGIWPDVLGQRVFDYGQWRSLADVNVATPSRAVLCVDVAPERKWATVASASHVDGRTLVMAHTEPGSGWVVAKVAELVARLDILEVVMVGGGQAEALAPDFLKANIEVTMLSAADQGAACAAFQEQVACGGIVHVDQPELNAAVGGAITRRIGERERWDRRVPSVDLSPLVAASGAAWKLAVDDVMPAIY